MTPPARTTLKTALAQYLLRAPGWVSAWELKRKFDIDERLLRQSGKHPGLCSEFAISHPSIGGGYKHIAHTTTAEWLEFKHAMRKHGIKELVRVRDLDKKRQEMRRGAPPVVFEKDSNQALMAM